MEKMFTSKQELDRISTEFEEEYNGLKDTICWIKDIVPGYNIGNIGLYSGNKIRSLYRRFENSGIDYVNSYVNKAIEVHFMLLHDRCVKLLHVFEDKASSKFGSVGKTTEVRKFIINSKELREYVSLCDMVYDFDLDRDICKVIDELLDETQSELGDEIDTWVDSYNDELMKLGVTERLDYRNKPKEIIKK